MVDLTVIVLCYLSLCRSILVIASVKQPSHYTGCVGLTSLDVNDHLMSSPHPWPVVVSITCKQEGEGRDKDGV